MNAVQFIESWSYHASCVTIMLFISHMTRFRLWRHEYLYLFRLDKFSIYGAGDTSGTTNVRYSNFHTDQAD